MTPPSQHEGGPAGPRGPARASAPGGPGGSPGDRTIEREGSFPARTKADAAVTRRFAVECAQCLRDDKCEDIMVLDVTATSQVTDYIVLGTGTSDRQMRAALDHLGEHARAAGFPPFGRSADDRATWLLADFVDVVVHLFEPGARAHYDLELLWGDAPRVEVPAGPGPLASGRRGPGA